jgi:hypothetical protein
VISRNVSDAPAVSVWPWIWYSTIRTGMWVARCGFAGTEDSGIRVALERDDLLLISAR